MGRGHKGGISPRQMRQQWMGYHGNMLWYPERICSVQDINRRWYSVGLARKTLALRCTMVLQVAGRGETGDDGMNRVEGFVKISAMQICGAYHDWGIFSRVRSRNMEGLFANFSSYRAIIRATFDTKRIIHPHDKKDISHYRRLNYFCPKPSRVHFIRIKVLIPSIHKINTKKLSTSV